MTTKDELYEVLSRYPKDSLVAVLESIQITEQPGDDQAAILTAQLWKHSHTPLGQLVRPNRLRDILLELAKRLELQDLRDAIRDGHETDDWHALDQLTDALLPLGTEVNLEALSAEHQEALRGSLKAVVGGAGTMGTSYLGRLAGLRVLNLLKHPLAWALQRLPVVGPPLLAVRTAAGAVVRLTGPIGILAAVLSLNAALGPNWRKVLQIVVGIGLIRRAEHTAEAPTNVVPLR